MYRVMTTRPRGLSALGQHGVTTQKTTMDIFIAVITSNPV
jgi:hypothetical protein